MNLLAPLVLQNFKKILSANPELWGCTIFRPKRAHLSWTKFYWYKPLFITVIYRLALFIVQNLKNSYSQSRVMKMHHFLGTKWSTCPKQIFFGKFINIIVFYLLAPFIVQNFKKILSVDPELGGCAIFGSKMAHLPKWDFFKKTCYFFFNLYFFYL